LAIIAAWGNAEFSTG